MIAFAEIALPPGGLVSWAVAGLLAAWFTAFTMKGGYGLLGDAIVGVFGAVLSGLLFTLFVTGTPGLGGSIVFAFCGGCILIAIFRALTSGNARA